MNIKLYVKPKIIVYIFRLDENLAASSSASVNVGDDQNPLIPKMNDFIQDESISVTNHQDI